MVSDQEPRYQLLDSSGTVVGTFYQKADGTLAVQDGVSESEVVFDGDTLGSGSETVDVKSVSTDEATIGGGEVWRKTDDQTLPIPLSDDTEYKIEYSTEVDGDFKLRLNGDADGNGKYHSVNVYGSDTSGVDDYILASSSSSARMEGAIFIRENNNSGNRTGFHHRVMLGGPFSRFNTISIAGGRDETDGLTELTDINTKEWVLFERARADRA